MARPPKSRVSPGALRKYCRGLKFADLGVLFLNLRKLLVDRHARNPGRANRELAKHDRANPDAHLRIRM